jgi:hypothetical protein
MHKLPIAKIEMDVSIQCRAAIDTATVNEYAESMSAGDKFPAVELFVSEGRHWIGDGWHRVMAAVQIGAEEISANVHPGGRMAALKCALSANSVHGQRRTNADKRRCVEIAVREFAKLSSRAIAEMCGVDHKTVEAIRIPPGEFPHLERTGQDGKQYPANRKSEPEIKQEEDEEPPKTEHRKLGPPCDGMQFARLAVLQLEQIREDDAERHEAFEHVKGWIEQNER